MSTRAPAREPVILTPGARRAYPMGRISAVFKADGDETARAYSISEWWLEPNTTGPGAHSHPEGSPGEFEPEMKGVAEWFAEHPPGDAR